jgi:hypothetical protein
VGADIQRVSGPEILLLNLVVNSAEIVFTGAKMKMRFMESMFDIDTWRSVSMRHVHFHVPLSCSRWEQIYSVLER